MTSLSYELDQLWADKTAHDRFAWFNAHGETIAAKHGAALAALREFAAVVKATRAHERHQFNVDEYVGNLADTMHAALAPEVAEWLEGFV